MKASEIFLLELFDVSFSYEKNTKEAGVVSKLLANPTVEVYDTQDIGPTKRRIRFYVFLHDGAWEIHFANEENEFDPGYLNLFQKNEVARIVATAMEIMSRKMKEKTTPVRIYGVDERMTNFYLRAIQRKIPKLEVRKIENFVGADGNKYRMGYVVRRDTRSFVKENLL